MSEIIKEYLRFYAVFKIRDEMIFVQKHFIKYIEKRFSACLYKLLMSALFTGI